MGIVIFGAMALYLIASIAVVVFVARVAKKKNSSPWRWGGGAALVMYLLVFWDYIPTVAAHKYYCEKEAGFWVYKTMDRWKKENPGVMETLVATKGAPSIHGAYILNQRFNWAIKKTGPFLFNRWRWEQQVVDSKTNEILARYVDFSTGNGNIGGEAPARFWLQSEHCIGGAYNQDALRKFRNGFMGAEK